MSWKKIKKMFPNGYTPGENSISIEELVDSDYDGLNSYKFYYARNMITKIVQHFWNKKGKHKQEIVYDLTSTDMPDNFSCLNVYGKKMLIDHKEKIITEENANNDGFNYTGI